MKREEKRELIRSNIVKSASKLMGENGVRNTAIQDICDNADISAVTLYKYFHSKEELAGEVAREDYSERYKSLIAIAKDEEIPFPQKMHKYVEHLIDIQKDKNSEISKEFEPIIENSVKIQDSISDWRDTLWQELVESGRKEGYVSESISDSALYIYLDSFRHYIADCKHLSTVEANLDGIETILLYGVNGKH